MPDRIDVATARELLDFAAGGGGVVSQAVAKEQLRGAVAIHNMLQDQGVAYLADEVGMGKTYVALGAMALLRHFRPDLRVMVLAPKENIQAKWIKEWRNFVRTVVRVEDLRVKAVGGNPARALVKVDSLVNLVTEASNDPDRDFFVRLTSFSLPVAGGDDTLAKRKGQLLRALPWLPADLINANRSDYKRNFGRAVNCALPDIDLLIVDEAHNLKAGWKEGKSSSTRNTVLGCALGGRPVEECAAYFKGYRRRVKKVLFLSATPIEYDIRQLWNQLDLFGFAGGWEALKDASLDHEQHREVVRRLLIRRTAELVSGDQRLTKSEYRREWRGGGIATHDDPLKAADSRQRLAVALVQKKVAEILGSGEHNHSFQVGLLASFESFMETVKSTALKGGTEQPQEEEDAADALFHKSAEERSLAREERRDGADIDAINMIAKDHLKTFKREMPHPKMDAIVDELARSFTTGRKALVFVRRVASVDELQRKLEEKYDALLFNRLSDSLHSDALRRQVQTQIDAYLALRQEERHGIRARDEFRTVAADNVEPSSVDSFFAWFFRGKGPDGVRSGASIALDLYKANSAYSTLLEDNHVAAVLRVSPGQVMERLAEVLGTTVGNVSEQIGREASRYLSTKRSAITTAERMQAFQTAALYLLRDVRGHIGQEASTILQELFATPVRDERADRLEPGAERWLAERTLFSELRNKPLLKERLWPDLAEGTFSDILREREVRREMLSTMIRKGHPIIDVFIIIANRIGSIARGAREVAEMGHPDLAEEILAELDRQARDEPNQFNSFKELAETASSYHLIVRLNAPELLGEKLTRIPTILGKTLRAQRPVAGMAGKVNTEVVKQFRMPGYPLILVTTDLLKEGEDLHTFCSNVYHYGIAWMPSELEQRVGRVDRVGSQTERRLGGPRSGGDEELLQVYYPHLNDTVEVLQLRRVYERLNRFMRMMHEGLGVPQKEQAEVRVGHEGLRFQMDTQAIRTPLVSAFRVTPPMVEGTRRALAASADAAAQMRGRLAAIEELVAVMGATSITRKDGHQIIGEMQLGSRVQPFTLILRSLRGRPLLRCVSPIGRVNAAEWDDELAASLSSAPYVRLALERNERYEAYDVAVEGDILLGAARHDVDRARDLIKAVIGTADRIEDQVLGRDEPLTALAAGLNSEVDVAR